MERWKEIDIAPGFTISESGVVRDPEGNIRNNYRNGDGYVGVAIKIESSDWVTMGVHRLVGLYFLESDRVDRKHINHLDGNIENNHWLNLEWVTPRENNIHATLLSTSNRHPKIFYEKDGCSYSALNIYQVSEMTGLNYLDIWRSIKNEVSLDGWTFNFRGKYAGKCEYVLRNYDTDEQGRFKPRSVKTRSVLTGLTKVFTSLKAAADYHGVNANAIHQAIPRDEHLRFLKKEFQVAYADEPFQNATADDVARALLHGAREVIAYNQKEKAYVTYKSAKEFYTMNKLSKKSVTSNLARNRLRDHNGWVALYKNEDNLKMLEDFLNRPI